MNMIHNRFIRFTITSLFALLNLGYLNAQTCITVNFEFQQGANDECLVDFDQTILSSPEI
jgi:hypothetical protein